MLGGPQDFLTRHSDLKVVGWCLAHNSATDYTNTPAIARSLCAGAVLAGCSDPHGLWLQIDDKGMRPRVDWVVRCISRCIPNRFVNIYIYGYISIYICARVSSSLKSHSGRHCSIIDHGVASSIVQRVLSIELYVYIHSLSAKPCIALKSQIHHDTNNLRCR